MAFGFHIAEPNEALIVSGSKSRGPAEAPESMKYKIITGDRIFVWPIFQSVRNLSLDLRKADLTVKCVTTQGIPVDIRGVIAFKVGDDYPAIANAARRFLGKEDTMEDRVHDLFAGHVRGIVGSLTVEELIRDRERLTTEARDTTGTELEKMGLIIDSLQIAEIDDPTGYIENLAKPQLAEVERNSRIAQADNDRQAAEKEAQAGALKAAAMRESDIKQAGFRAEVDKANAEASQAGPLQEAESRRAVVEAETEIAALQAAQRERQLETEIKKPADAEAYRAQKIAEGSKQATILDAEATAAEREKIGQAEAAAEKAKGLASAEVIKAKGEAEGDALKARADGLERNQDAVIGQQLAEQFPEIVKAAAAAFDNVDNMTVLNGADGVMTAMTSIITQGQQALNLARTGFQPQTPEPVAVANGHKGDGSA